MNNDDSSIETQTHLDSLTMARDMSLSSTFGSLATAAGKPGGESGYEPWYPNNVPVDSSVKLFITRFFEVSDDPDRNDEWVYFFREDATLIMMKDIAKGKDEIRKLRRDMWRDVEARKHRLVKLFPASFSPDQKAVMVMHEKEFMLFGAVAYRMKDGSEAVAGFAAHAQLRRDSLNASWKFVFYRVYVQK
ncbi:hypothetical protein N657DRAFT_645469 [Parathielavia appendiculata]|uniref:Uncharacterized protein n=1 Tax=Parathielavia appendiculata TaxID=2587402 RepID=A0AAN6U0S4_9PEZI|nr:hypothetical protein N657DRAFT_645469 [Parathielavia appendiculata]